MAATAKTDVHLRPCPQFDRAHLPFLRVMAVRARCAARVDMFKESVGLPTEGAGQAGAVALILFRGLMTDDTGGAFRMYEPSACEISFDERWLLAALGAAARGDTDSLTFLLARRMPRPIRRPVGCLIKALARTLEPGYCARAA